MSIFFCLSRTEKIVNITKTYVVDKNKQKENFKEMSKHIFTCYYFIIYLFSYSYLSRNDF